MSTRNRHQSPADVHHFHTPETRRDAHLLVVISDDVGGRRARVLHLDTTIGSEWIQCDRAVVIECVSPMLPKDARLNTRGIGCIGLISILRLFKESLVCAESPHQSPRRVGQNDTYKE